MKTRQEQRVRLMSILPCVDVVAPKTNRFVMDLIGITNLKTIRIDKIEIVKNERLLNLGILMALSKTLIFFCKNCLE